MGSGTMVKYVMVPDPVVKYGKTHNALRFFIIILFKPFNLYFYCATIMLSMN